MIRKHLFFALILLVPLFLTGQIKEDAALKEIKMRIFENPDQALTMATDLLKTEKNPDRRIDIILLISNGYVAKRDYDQSLKYILQAKSALNENTEPIVKSNVLLSIAIQYQQMELFSKCLETLNEAEISLSKITDKNPQKLQILGKIFAIRGMVYKSENNPELALKKLIEGVQHIKKSTPYAAKYANLSVFIYNIAYCYIEMNQLQEAKTHFLQAISYAKQANAKSLESFALKGLADMYQINGQYEESLQNLTEAQKLAENIGDLVLEEGIYKGFADNYLALNQLDNYQIYNKKFMEVRFQRGQKELTSINSSIDNQNKEYQKKITNVSAMFRWFTGILVVLTTLYLAGIFYLIQKKRRENLSYQKRIQEIINEK